MKKGENTLERRCEGHERSPSPDRLMIKGEDILERKCEGHDMTPIPNASKPM
jgi:hypothetical protein